MTPISAIIMTKNEELLIRRCIESVRWADEVFVIDSGSTDRTRDIAASLDATVYEQEWLGFSEQRNKAASLARNDWVLFLDADEIVTPELRQSIESAMRGSLNGQDGYTVDRRGDFLGVLLPNETRPSKRRNFVRLYNKHYSRYDPAMKVHEEVRFSGQAIPLEGILLHWRGSDMHELFGVFNRYATVEAEVLYEQGRRANALTVFVRPILRFLWSYLVKGGFRLGGHGLVHSMLKATSDFMRYAKLWEMEHGARTVHPPKHIYPGGANDEELAQHEVSL